MNIRQMIVSDDPYGFEPNLAHTQASGNDLKKDGLVCREPLHRPYESHGGREYTREELQPRDEV